MPVWRSSHRRLTFTSLVSRVTGHVNLSRFSCPVCALIRRFAFELDKTLLWSFISERAGQSDSCGERRRPMLRLLIAVLVFACVILPAASAQTTDSGYPDELSPSLAASAKAMHAMIHRDIKEAAENMPADEYAFRPTA